MKLGIMIVMLAILFPVSRIFKERLKIKALRQKIFLQKWQSAKQEREWWRIDHDSFFNFFHPEYQRLFEIEIGAEALYRIHQKQSFIKDVLFCMNFSNYSSSWDDYCKEKRAFEQEETS